MASVNQTVSSIQQFASHQCFFNHDTEKKVFYKKCSNSIHYIYDKVNTVLGNKQLAVYFTMCESYYIDNHEISVPYDFYNVKNLCFFSVYANWPR